VPDDGGEMDAISIRDQSDFSHAFARSAADSGTSGRSFESSLNSIVQKEMDPSESDEWLFFHGHRHLMNTLSGILMWVSPAYISL
jgi:hypothetical protein